MRLCTECGKAYASEAVYCPYCGKPPYNLGRLCPRGHSNPPTARYCETCGASELSDSAPRPSFKRTVAFLCIGGGVILILTSLIFSLFGSLAMLLLPCLLLFALLPKDAAGGMNRLLFSIFGGFIRLTFRATMGIINLMFRALFSEKRR